MACYHPIKAWTSYRPGEKITFKKEYAHPTALLNGETIPIPCGQCVGCRLARSNQWAIRCVHEASLHEQNSFITLTYHDDNLPKGGTLVKKDFQDFMKRLRKSIAPKKIRYYMAGEYGDKLGRPHYHALIFGHDFGDKYLWETIGTKKYYRSPELERLWQKGYSNISDVNIATAGYVARYVMKKITGDAAKDHYGEKIPEYNDMSRRPGVATEWIKKYKSDVFPKWGKTIDGVWRPDGVAVDGRQRGTPKFYLQKLKEVDPEEYKLIESARKLLGIQYAQRFPEEKTERRLKEKEIVCKSKLQLKKRKLK
ncbi:replication initiator protein [Microviridae sp.]|nr:replication initiator protein [Microviridae sp.]